ECLVLVVRPTGCHVVSELRRERVTVLDGEKAQRADDGMDLHGLEVLAEDARVNPARDETAELLDDFRRHLFEDGRLRHVPAEKNVLDHDDTNEVAVLEVEFERPLDQRAYRFPWREPIQLELQLARAHYRVGML